METNQVLHFSWEGDEKDIKGMTDPVLCLYVNGEEYVKDWNYNDGFTIDIPISESILTIEVKIGKSAGSKRATYFKHEFPIQNDADYSAKLEGEATSFTGLKLKLSNPNEDVEENTPACHRNLPIAFLSYAFPIYGIINAIRTPYNRKAALISAAIGFTLAMILSAMVPEHGETGIGFGKTMIISYKPFSFLDWVFNLLIGGIAALRGFLYLLLDAIF